MVDSPVPDLRKRLSVALGRDIGKYELQGDILVELLETLEELRARGVSDDREPRR